MVVYWRCYVNYLSPLMAFVADLGPCSHHTQQLRWLSLCRGPSIQWFSGKPKPSPRKEQRCPSWTLHVTWLHSPGALQVSLLMPTHGCLYTLSLSVILLNSYCVDAKLAVVPRQGDRVALCEFHEGAVAWTYISHQVIGRRSSGYQSALKLPFM